MYIILFCVIFTRFAQSSEIHKYMTAEQISDIFQTTSENVPPYEVVSIKHELHKRSTGDIGVQMKINGMDKKLYLKPVTGDFASKRTKVWTARPAPNSPNKLIYHLHTGAMENVGTFYQDRLSSSAISHRVSEEGNSRFDGFSGNHVIRSLPNHLRNRREIFERNVPSHENVTEKEDSNNNYHVIYKRQFIPNYGPINPGYQAFPGNMPMDYQQQSKLGKPKVIYPEIMVFVDNAIFSLFDRNVDKAVNYILSFWNGVDLRFRELKNPEVFLNIAGIVFIEGDLPFANQFSSPHYRDKMFVPEALDMFATYLHREDKIQLKRDYDLALLMTGKDLTAAPMKTGVLGIAKGGGACRSYYEGFLAAGILEDNGGYVGIVAAAHELAHLLGAPHDGEGALEGIGGPGAKGCPFSQGYMMSYARLDTNQFHFSPCSRNAMTYFASLEIADCLRNYPHKKKETEQLPRMLPGKLMTLDEQCKKQGYYASSYKDASVCTHLVCRVHPASVGSVRNSAAAEGSYCGNGMYCLDGECVKESSELQSSSFKPSLPVTTESNIKVTQTDAPRRKPINPSTLKPRTPVTIQTESPFNTNNHEITAEEFCKKKGAKGAQQTKSTTQCHATCIYGQNLAFIFKSIPFENGHPCSVDGVTGKCENGKCKTAKDQ